MPPSKWDDEESEETSSEEETVPTRPVAPVRRKFDDEEDSDDVADNWEEDEDSEVEREKAKNLAEAKAKADAEAVKNKKSKSQRIEEHREEARRRREAADEDNDDSSEDEEDEAAKRARLRKSEQDADLKNAQDLLANAGLGPTKRSGAPNKALIIEDKDNPGQAIDLSQLSLFKPSTKPQFDALSATLVPLLNASASKPHYALWVQNFVKQICAEIPSTEIKKAASGLTALSNEKMKEEKTRDGTKKTKAAKSKTTLAAGRDIGRGVADTTSYEDDLGDEDFM